MRRFISAHADFYVGQGKQAEWLGSIANYGHPQYLPPCIKDTRYEDIYRLGVRRHLDIRPSGVQASTEPWPWPWANSSRTDFTYTFSEGILYVSYFGSRWRVASEVDKHDDWNYSDIASGKYTYHIEQFPDMEANEAERLAAIMFPPRVSQQEEENEEEKEEEKEEE